MSGRWQPTDAELDVIARHNTTEAARIIGRSKDVIIRARRENDITNPFYRTRATHAATEPIDEDDLAGRGGFPEYRQPIWNIPEDAKLDSGLWTAFEQAQQEMASIDTERDEVDVSLPGDRPALVVFLSDLHIGHTACQMQRLRTDLETIRNTPNMYCILGGDLTDNVVTSVASRGMHHEQLAPLRVQKHLTDEMTKYLGRNKVIAMILGNHDAWSISNDDFDPIKYLADKLNVPYLGAYGFINASIGRECYRILAAHMFRMRSSFNKTHQAKRLMDFMGDADAVFTGHTHDSAAESTHVRQKRAFFGQSGTYMRSSRYSKALGFTPATSEMPGVILFPNEHKIIGVHDGIIDGPRILKAFS